MVVGENASEGSVTLSRRPLGESRSHPNLSNLWQTDGCRAARQLSYKLVIAEYEGWSSAKVATLPEDLAGSALTQITPRARGIWAHRDSQDRGRSPHDSPHGLYRALILAPGRPVTLARKWGLTRKYSHAVSLLIMVWF